MFGDILQWAITITGIISLVLVIARGMNKEESGWITILQKVNAVAIKVGSLSAVILLMYIFYLRSGGMLSIQAIGFYIACSSILFSLTKDYKINAQFLEDVGSVVSYKADAIQRSIAEQAAQAKKESLSKNEEK